MLHRRNTVGLALGIGCLLTALPWANPAWAQDVGETVLRQGRISENYYAAGSTVRLQAQVTGDVVVAGGVVDLDGETSGNLIVAGGEVRLQQRLKGDLLAVAGSLEVRGDMGDDARIAGGEVRVYAHVHGDLIAAGGRLTVAPAAHVDGRAALGGAQVEVNGTFKKRLLVAGRSVAINGVVEGDVEVEAQRLTLGPAARIGGALTYRSPEAARIDPAAQVAGKVEHIVSPIGRNLDRARGVARIGAGAALAVMLLVVGAAWYGLFPAFSHAAPGTLRASPWRSALVGIALVAGAPLAGSGLAATVIGLPIAAVLLFLYPPALLLGLVTAAFCLGDWGLRRTGRAVTTGARLLALLAAAVVLSLLAVVPYLGPLLLLAALLSGVGAFWLRLVRADAGR
jgi:cytoskeletal protein CcmA (bactofilin family)